MGATNPSIKFLNQSKDSLDPSYLVWIAKTKGKISRRQKRIERMECPNCKEDTKNPTKCERCGHEISSSAATPNPLQQQQTSIEPEAGMPSSGPAENLLPSASALPPVAGPPQLGAPASQPGHQPPPSSAESLGELPDGNKGKKAEKKLPSPPVQPEKHEDRKESKIKNKSGKGTGDKHSVKDSEIAQYAVMQGTKNILVRNDNHFHGDRPRELIDEKNFIELTSPLPLFDSEYPDSAFEHLQEYLAILKRERILLVSCYDEHLAQAAAHALINRLHLIDNEQKRLLNFESISIERSSLNLFSSIEERSDSDEELAILIDATSKGARFFLDSLLNEVTSSSPSMIKEGLKSNNLFLVCIADSETVDRRLKSQTKKLPFIHWRILFLETVLKFHYPDLAADKAEQIKQQRRNGKWSKDESEFCYEINDYLKEGQLLSEIKAHEAINKSLEIAFQDNDSVEDTVLYTAAGFAQKAPKSSHLLCK